MKLRRDGLLGLERCLGVIVADILNILEECDPEEAQMRLLLQEFPAFSDYFRQLYEADKNYACQCISHWLLYLKGPPNNPTKDLFGLVEVTVRYLNSIIKTLQRGNVSSNSNLNFDIYDANFANFVNNEYDDDDDDDDEELTSEEVDLSENSEFSQSDN